MTTKWTWFLGAALGVAQTTVFAGDATVPYNEAVRIVAGQRIVDMPSLPPYYKSLLKGKPSDNGGRPSQRIGVETPDGLMDCTGTPWFYEPACERSTFGRVKWARSWVVKTHGEWKVCVGRLKPIKCVELAKAPWLPTVEE